MSTSYKTILSSLGVFWSEKAVPRVKSVFFARALYFMAGFVSLLLAFFVARWWIHTQPFATPPVEVHPLTVPLPAGVPDPADNIRTPEKIALGHKLFFDARLSRSGTISCNSCHTLSGVGVDHRTVSVGEQGRAGPRNAPTVFNTGYLAMLFWDGRAVSLEAQAASPLTTPHEMDMTPDEIVLRLLRSGYLPYFAAAFPEDDEPVSFTNTTKALAAFQRTLVTPNAPFDQYMRGNYKALNERQLAGLHLFQDARCASCHHGPMLGGDTFMEFAHGVSTDKGRGELPGQEDEQFVFRVAPLRNVTLTYPYFHDGSAATIEQAVSAMINQQVGRPFNEHEAGLIIEFLRTLEGEFPKIDHPELPDNVPDYADLFGVEEPY